MAWLEPHPTGAECGIVQISLMYVNGSASGCSVEAVWLGVPLSVCGQVDGWVHFCGCVHTCMHVRCESEYVACVSGGR